MKQNPVAVSTPCISLLVVALLFFSLAPFSSSSLREAEASPPTAISPTDGTGSLASLGTIITSGTSTVPTNLCSTSCVITGGTAAGHNLFHSFGDFNIGASDSARFQTGLVNPLPDVSVSNILARVTGGQSNLYGSLDSATYYPSANLFLMNPAGFLFGPNATVNVGGMVAFTSADYLKLTDGARFNAIPNGAADALLTALPVASFGFLGSNPGAITVQGSQFSVTDGQSISLVGGDVTIQLGTPDGGTAQLARLSAPNGNILLASAASPGEFAAATLQALPNVNGASFTSFGSIALTSDALTSDSSINVSGTNMVSIRGGQFVLSVNDAVLTTSQTPGLSETISLSPGSSILTSNSGTDPGTDVQLIASNVLMDRASIVTSPAEGSNGKGDNVTISVTGSATFTDSFIQTGPVVSSGAGSAGALSITANDSLTMTNTFIDASSQQAGGDAGPVTLATNGLLSLTDSVIVTASTDSGNGGVVTITGKDVTFDRAAVFTIAEASTPALGEVRSGAVNVTADDTVTLSATSIGDFIINTSALGTLGDAGQVMIIGKTVNLSNGMIDASLHNGDIVSPGNSGAIEIRSNSMNLTQFSLFSLADGVPGSTGTGGSILLRGTSSINADNIQLTASQMNTSATTGGGAGKIVFQTKTLTISDQTEIGSSSFGQGPVGTVTVKGAENVAIESGSRVSTEMAVTLPGVPQGAGGDILFETQNLILLSGGHISASALPNSTGNAGNISVLGGGNSPSQSILIDGTGSGIFTDTQGAGAGGNIFVNANSVTLQNGGTLSAKTLGTASSATGGTITVDATNTVTMNRASITASSKGVADAGSIDLTAMNGFSMQNSTITTQAGQGAGGGNIKVSTSPEATVLLQNSLISASVADGRGGGGNISIDPQFVILQNSQILAQAAQGQGGAITIIANLFLSDANSIVNADSGSGVNGTVTIQSPNAPISGQIQPLGKTPLIATSLLNQHCASLAGGEFSSFTVAGRDSLPIEPGGWLSSPLYAGGVGLGIKAEGVKAEGERLKDMSASAGQVDSGQWRVGETPLLSLRQIAPAGFLTQAFAVDWSASCQS